jgi:C4-dicarboxylate-specific signal transduction histidine kinase
VASFNKLNYRKQLLFLGLSVLILFIVFSFFNYTFYKKVSLGGPLHQRLENNNSFMTDLAPPTLYIADAYLEIHRIQDYENIAQYGLVVEGLKHIDQLHLRTLEALKKYKQIDFEFAQKEESLKELERSITDFYDAWRPVRDQLVLASPEGYQAIIAHSFKSLLPVLDNAFEENEKICYQILTAMEKVRQNANQKISSEVKNEYLQNLFILLIVLFLVLFISLRSVERQGKKLVAMNEVATARLRNITKLNVLLDKNQKNLLQLNADLESFSYSVAHDLKSPLRSMTGFTSLIEEDYGKDLPEEVKDYLKRISGSALKMGQLIDDLLLLGKVSRETLRVEEVSLSKIVE